MEKVFSAKKQTRLIGVIRSAVAAADNDDSDFCNIHEPWCVCVCVCVCVCKMWTHKCTCETLMEVKNKPGVVLKHYIQYKLIND